jgi:hypothetical protein
MILSPLYTKDLKTMAAGEKIRSCDLMHYMFKTSALQKQLAAVLQLPTLFNKRDSLDGENYFLSV